MTVKFSQQLTTLLKSETLTVEQVLAVTKTASFGFLLCLVALPSALPVPAPGFSMPFGVLIIVLAVQLLIGRKTLWLPATWQQKSVNVKAYHGKMKTILKFVHFFEWFVRPRLSFVYRLGTPVLAFIMVLCGTSMLIPIPGTNSLPALGVFLMSLGMIEKDGLAGIAGAAIGLFGLTLAVLIVFLGAEALTFLLELISF